MKRTHISLTVGRGLSRCEDEVNDDDVHHQSWVSGRLNTHRVGMGI
jgi:hypothetical protein